MNFRKKGGEVTPIQKISLQILAPLKKKRNIVCRNEGGGGGGRGRLEVFQNSSIFVSGGVPYHQLGDNVKNQQIHLEFTLISLVARIIDSSRQAGCSQSRPATARCEPGLEPGCSVWPGECPAAER